MASFVMVAPSFFPAARGRLVAAAWMLVSATAVDLAPPLRAQPQSIRFRHLNTDQGLSQGSVHAIVQDPYGFLWIGTQDGLDRWDGREFVSYHAAGAGGGGLVDDYVRALELDPHGDLWIGTDSGGLARRDRDGGTFEIHRHDPATPDGLGSDRIHALWADRAGGLWIATEAGLDHLDLDSRTITPVPLEPEDGAAFSLRPHGDGSLWVGTDGGLRRIDVARRRLAEVREAPWGRIKGPVRAILRSDEGKLWIGADDALFRLDLEGQRDRDGNGAEGDDGLVRFTIDSSTPLGGTRVRDLLEDHRGHLWIATDAGLHLFHPGQNEFVGYRHHSDEPGSLSHDSVITLFEDRGGLLWVGTLSGANRWRLDEWTFGHFESRSGSFTGSSIYAFSEDRSGTYTWIGTYDDGLQRWRPEDGFLEVFRHDPADPASLADNRVMSLLTDRRDRLWVGTNSGGLNLFDPESGGFFHVRHDPEDPTSLGADRVTALFEDRAGQLWIGSTRAGASRVDSDSLAASAAGGRARFTVFPGGPDAASGLESGLVTCFAEGIDGPLWVGTNGGLHRFVDGTFELVGAGTGAGALPGEKIFALHTEDGATLWVASNAGLSRTRLVGGVPKFQSFGRADGLPNETVYGIQPDADGFLWLSTNKGLSRFDPRREVFRNFDVRHGLQAAEYNFGAHYRGRDGRLYFGGNQGFNAFYPASIVLNTEVPPVVLTALRKQNRPVDNGVPPERMRAVQLHHRDRSVTFEFAALDFNAPEAQRFAYWLEGFEEDWVELDRPQPITYNSLDPGSYVFRVKASNGDGVWNEDGLRIAVEVAPSPWSTWWAYAGYALMLAGIGYAGARWRMRELERRSQDLELVVTRRTAELSDTVERLRISERSSHDAQKRALKALEEALGERRKAQEADRAKSLFLSSMSHELRTPLNAILGFAQLMERDLGLVAEHREQIDAILRSGEHLLGLINDVLSLSKIEAGKLALDPQPFDLRRLATGVEEMIRSRADAKHLVLRLDVDDAVPDAVSGDSRRLAQVLLNLVGNAVKFTDRGRVDVRVRWREGAATFEVQDTGRGIAEDELPKLFRPFSQTQSGENEPDGTGLGLAISQALIQRMGGEIHAESTLGQGSTFHFTLPLPAASRAAVPRRRRWAVGLLPGSRPQSILVADDAAETRELMVRLLEPVGLEVRTAKNGREAVEIWASWRPALIWMDMKMPDISGYEATRRIRQAEAELGTGRTIIVALTATAFEHDRRRVLATGCDDWVTKPFRTDLLFDKLTEHLDLRFRWAEPEVDGAQEAPAALPRGGRRAGSIKVLVAEDNRDNQKVARRMLEKLGYRVDIAADGAAALAAFADAPYDMVLMDVRMPGVDGLEATRRLRAAHGRDVPIIALTGLVSDEERRRCRDAGMDAVLGKPFRLDDLKGVVERWLAFPALATAPASLDDTHVPLPDSGSVLDHRRLDQLRQLDEETVQPFAEHIIGLYLETVPTQVEDLRRAVEHGDLRRWRHLAHGLKNSSNNLGAVQVAETCAELERVARETSPTDPAAAEAVARRLLARLEAELEMAMDALARERG
ncbi:MAG: two-component regulator propeller domain-containing protein [Acidobacteriota bacterium]